MSRLCPIWWKNLIQAFSPLTIASNFNWFFSDGRASQVLKNRQVNISNGQRVFQGKKNFFWNRIYLHSIEKHSIQKMLNFIMDYFYDFVNYFPMGKWLKKRNLLYNFIHPSIIRTMLSPKIKEGYPYFWMDLFSSVSNR